MSTQYVEGFMRCLVWLCQKRDTASRAFCAFIIIQILFELDNYAHY